MRALLTQVAQLASFPGLVETATNSGPQPPDSNIAAGSSSLVSVVNRAITLSSLTGSNPQTAGLGWSNSLGDFWSRVSHPSQWIDDSSVLFDSYSNRFWVLTNVGSTDGSGNAWYDIAVSRTSNPQDLDIGESSPDDWYFYTISSNHDFGSGVDGADFPRFAVDSTGLYVAANYIRNGTLDGVYVVRLDKTPMLSGSLGTEVGVVAGNGAFTLVPVQSQGRLSTDPQLFVDVGQYANGVRVWQMNSSGQLTLVTTLSAPFTGFSRGTMVAPQEGTATYTIDGLDSRLMNAVYRNGSIWTVHTININYTETAVRWYQINTVGVYSIAQQGTIDAGAGVYSFCPAIAVDQSNDAAITYTQSSANQYPEMMLAVRAASDPAGTLGTPIVVEPSPGYYSGDIAYNNTTRWGDFTGVAADPGNGSQFWVYGEYAHDASYWGTWGAEYSFQTGIQVNLASYATAVGITTPGSNVKGSIANNSSDSLSSQALATAANWTSGQAYVWNGQTFNLPANANDIVPMGGNAIPIPQGSYTALYVLALSAGYSTSQAGVFTLFYSDNSSDQYTQGISDWRTGYTGVGGTTAPGESIVATMSQHDTWNGTQDVSTAGNGNTAYLYGYVIPVDPSRTLQDLSLPNNSNMRLLAVNAVDNPPYVQFPVSCAGMSQDNNYQLANINNTDEALSSVALSNAANWTSGRANVWEGQAFTLGPAGQSDVALIGGQNITVPQGNYTNLMILAGSVRGAQSAQFTVHYTDGSSHQFNQTISDILTGYTGTPGTTAPGESIAVAMNYYNNTVYGPQQGTNAYLYGYNFAINPTKTLSYIQTNNNNNMAIFAIDAVNVPAQVNLGSVVDHTSGNNAQIPFNGSGISEDNAYQSANINGTNETLSSVALTSASNWTSGAVNVWNSQTFTLGPTASNNIVLVGGQNITVPHGSYTDLMILAGSVRGAQSAQFTVHYTDGSYTFNQTISDILTGYTGTPGTTAPGESIAVAMNYYNNTVYGPQQGTKSYLYGYDFTLDPTKTLSYISLNNNVNMAVFAIDLVNTQARQQIAMAPTSDSSAVASANLLSVPGNPTGSAAAPGSENAMLPVLQI